MRLQKQPILWIPGKLTMIPVFPHWIVPKLKLDIENVSFGQKREKYNHVFKEKISVPKRISG